MRLTLLRMTQLILSSMDSDEVNSIADTEESSQVVDIIEQVYNDIVSQVDFPNQWDLFELEPSLDASRPTLMYIPDDVSEIEWIQYDYALTGETVRDFKTIPYMPRLNFFNRMNNLDSAATNTYSYDYLVGSQTFPIVGYSDREPLYYTTVDNNTLIFDNYRSTEGSTLLSNKTYCYGMKIPAFSRVDTWVPDFDPRQFTLLFNEAKSQCFIELKQIQNVKSERNARRGWNYSSRKKDTTDASPINDSFTPNYGRRRPR